MLGPLYLEVRSEFTLWQFEDMLSLLAKFVELHTSSERKNNFVPRYSKLSHVQAALQLSWVHIFPWLTWIVPSGLTMCLALSKVSGLLQHSSKWARRLNHIHQCLSGANVLAWKSMPTVINVYSNCVLYEFWNLMRAEFWEKMCLKI